jgi:nucleotide-binding universal stress UspA family protein
MFHKILVAVDDTEMDRHVFDEAVSIAKVMNARLMLLHVLVLFDEQFLNPLFVEPYLVYPTFHTDAKNQYMTQWEEIKQKGVEFLKSLCDQANAAGVATEVSQNTGDPGQLICQVARSWEADLVVVGRRGYKGLSEFFLGSVSNYVLHHAPCSVLTVQGPIHATVEDAPQAQVV